MNVDQSGIWVATAEVRPNPGNELLNGAQGAYVPVVGFAASAVAFEAVNRRAMTALVFELVELADVRFLASPC